MKLLKKYNTIQNQILLGFLTLTLSVGLLIFITYTYFKRYKSVTISKNIVDEIYQKSFHLMYIDNRILTEDIMDSTFYIDRSSLLLKQHRVEFNNIIQDLTIEIHPELYRYNLDKDLAITSKSFEKYDSLFNLILLKQWERGFKDYGLEGGFRDTAHEIEKYNDILPLEKLLSLRRHEKDYFLRNEIVYVEKFNELSNEIIQELKSKTSQSRVDLVLYLLKSYQNTFNKVYKIESEIGDKNSGLMYELITSQENIESNIERIKKLADAESQEIETSIYINFGFSVTLCIVLSTLMAFIIARLLAQPVVRLAEVIEKPLADLLALDNLQEYTSSYSSYEIEKLQEAFEILFHTIKDQIGQITTSNALLSTQNEELLGINEKLSESESKLNEALSVKDKFFSIIAHDLKGPIASLTSFLKLFINYNDSFSKEEIKDFAQKMQVSTESLSELLENLLTWSRSQMGHIQLKLQKAALEEIVDKNFILLDQKVTKKNISLIKDLHPNSFLWADSDVVNFVLRNIISNAVKFSYPNGEIRVRSKVEGDFILISVEDDGVGIPLEIKENLFNPHIKITTKGTADEKGTGLGLLLCKEFVEKNQGKIWIESDLNKGSKFTFSFLKYSNHLQMEDIE